MWQPRCRWLYAALAALLSCAAVEHNATLFCPIRELCRQITAHHFADSQTVVAVLHLDAPQPLESLCASVSRYDDPRLLCSQETYSGAPRSQLPLVVSRAELQRQDDGALERLHRVHFVADTAAPGPVRSVAFAPRSLFVVDHLRDEDLGAAGARHRLVELTLTSPPFGSVTTAQPVARFAALPPGTAAIRVAATAILDGADVAVGPDSSFLQFGVHELEAEPASWFVTLTPLLRDARDASVAVDGAADAAPLRPALPSRLYVEVVPSPAQIERERLFVDPPAAAVDGDAAEAALLPRGFDAALRRQFAAEGYLTPETTPPTRVAQFVDVDPAAMPPKSPGRSRVCLSGGLAMDGQRRIWLDQLRFFAARPELRLDFVYVFSGAEDALRDASNPASLLFYLQRVPRLLLVEAPQLRVALDDLAQPPDAAAIDDDGADGYGDEDDDGEDVDVSAAAFVAGDARNESRLFDYAHRRFLRARGDLAALSPRWVRTLYSRWLEFWAFVACDVVVFGNSRGLTADVFLVDLAARLHVPTVAELVNLFLHRFIVPDVVVAPSHYALRHASVAHALRPIDATDDDAADAAEALPPLLSLRNLRRYAQRRAWRHQTRRRALGVVVSPGVDPSLFNATRFAAALRSYAADAHVARRFDGADDAARSAVYATDEPTPQRFVVQRPRGCPAVDLFVGEAPDAAGYAALLARRLPWRHFPCVVVAFVGRLHPSKNPALFVLMAHALRTGRFRRVAADSAAAATDDDGDADDVIDGDEAAAGYPFARFRFIGDGPLRGDLEALVQRLGLADVFEFVGWVADEAMPAALAQVDVVVNPTLRAWSETFCIANVEALAMARPLVTFAVGGIGEYVRRPNASAAGPAALWSVADNAVLVHVADPRVLAAALHATLLSQPHEARRLGERGRASVERQFTPQRQLAQYARLYAAVRDARRP